MKKVLVSIFILAIVISLGHLAAGQAGSNSLNDQLIQAAKSGDTTAVRQLLDKGANIEASDKDGKTALIRAAENSRIEAVQLLLAKGANIEARENDGSTALIEAVIDASLTIGEKDNSVVKLLLEKGANVNARNNYGKTRSV